MVYFYVKTLIAGTKLTYFTSPCSIHFPPPWLSHLRRAIRCVIAARNANHSETWHFLSASSFSLATRKYIDTTQRMSENRISHISGEQNVNLLLECTHTHTNHTCKFPLFVSISLQKHSNSHTTRWARTQTSVLYNLISAVDPNVLLQNICCVKSEFVWVIYSVLYIHIVYTNTKVRLNKWLVYGVRQRQTGRD